MKIFLISILFTTIFSTSGLTQNDTICGILPKKNDLVNYSEIIDFDSISAKNLYLNTKIWISESFGSAKSVTESDVENSFLSIKGFVNFQNDNKVKIDFMFNFYLKDNKIKYEVTKLQMRIPAIDSKNPIEMLPALKNCNMETIINIDKSIKSVIESYLSRMIDLCQTW